MSKLLDAVDAAAPSIPKVTPVSHYFTVVTATQPDKMQQTQQCFQNWQAGLSDLHLNGTPCVPVPGAPSMSAAYNAALAQVKTPFVIFAHNDAYPPPIPSFRIGQRLIARMERLDLAGFCGSSKFCGVRWQDYSTRLYGAVLNMPQQPGQQCSCQTWLRPARIVTGIRVADGFCIVARTEAIRDLGFAPEIPAFHMYDLDIFLRAHERGLRTGIICDVPIIHQSGVGYGDPKWEEGTLSFIARWSGKADPFPFGIGQTPGSITGIDPRMVLRELQRQEVFMADEIEG